MNEPQAATECFAIDDIEAPDAGATDDRLTFRVTWPTGTGCVAFDDASAVAPDQRERTWVLAWLNERVITTNRTAVEDELRRESGLRIT